MRKIFLRLLPAVLALALLTAICAHAQAFSRSCDSALFANPSAALTSEQGARVLGAENQLSAKGADPRVILDDTAWLTPEQYVAVLEKACPSWQSADGGVKNNLIVFLVFPKRRKVGLFVGNEFGKAINASVVRSQFMAPAFRDGDYARGFIAGINEVGVEIEAFQTAALHPTTTVVNRQATDFSGLWKWLDGLLILAFLIGAWGLAVYYRNRRREARDAQQRAVQARNEAAERINVHPDGPGAEEFAHFSASETYNPDTNGLSVAQYNAIAEKYNDLARSSPAGNEPAAKKGHRSPAMASMRETAASSPAPSRTGVAPSSPISTTVIEHHTTVIDRDYVPVPVILDEPYRASAREPEPSDSEPSSGWSDSSSSSDFGGGGGFSDSSSSSDFGGGGGDFGGGSSDF